MKLKDLLEVVSGSQILIRTKQAGVLTWRGGEYEYDECFSSDFLNKKVENIYASDNCSFVICIEGFS